MDAPASRRLSRPQTTAAKRSGATVGSDEAAFAARNRARVRTMAEDTEFQDLSRQWFVDSCRHEYSYHFTWLGRPIIQYPQDIVALQEIIWRVQPDWIVETGIARGGSLILSASLLELTGGDGRVLGIDIDIRAHNRAAVEAHPLSRRIEMIEGSSVDEDIASEARRRVAGSRALVILDSNHTHDHVLDELRLYAPLVRAGSYLIVLDTCVDDMPESLVANRPWGPGNSPRTAVETFLAECDRFAVDEELDAKLAITVAPRGYLRCLSD